MNRRKFVCCSAALGGSALLGQAARAAEPGVHSDKIIFGQSVGFESVWGSVFRDYADGLLAYFNYINAQGGVYGRKLVVKQLEDGYSSEKTVANIKSLLQDGVFGLAGMGGTGTTIAALPLIEQYRLPTVGALTGATAVRKAGVPLFHTRATYAAEIAKMVQQATTIGLKRIAVVHQENAFGTGSAQAAREAAQKYGAQIVTVIPHNEQGGDIDVVVDKIQASNPHATLLFTSAQAVADMLVRYHAKHGPLPMPQPWVLSVTVVKTVFEKAGQLARGVALTQVMPNPDSRTLPLVREFREVNDRFGVKSNKSYLAVEGFLTAKVIVAGLRACGANPTREAFISSLEAFGTRDFGGLRVRYDRSDHSGLEYVEVAMIGNDGRIVS